MDDAPETRLGEFEREALPHLDAVHGLALRLTGGDAARSEDLVRASVLEAWRSWDRLEVGSGRGSALLTLLRDAVLDEALRATGRETAGARDEVVERPSRPALFEADPEGHVLERIRGPEIARAIEELPDLFRIPLVLADVEGFGYREIAGELGVPVETVKSRLFDGRRALQDRLLRHAVAKGYLE